MDTGDIVKSYKVYKAESMIKKISKKILFIIIIMLLGGLGGIIADRYLFPYLSSTDYFIKHDFLKKSASDVTVINKTEQVFMKEESSINKISNQTASSIVNIISYPEQGAKKGVQKNGTGVVVTSDGLIMTYASAISQGNFKYKVMTYDGKIYDGELQGVDSYSNLAFLKINGNNLSVISLGNSADAEPGEKVVAIGNSFGAYANRYAAGLLSNFNPTYNLSGKTVSSSEKLEGVFGTDFNSEEYLVGGPIVDYSGQTVGIIGSQEKDNDIIYFQIPSNAVKKVIERAIKKEFDKNPELGIYYVPITKTSALLSNLNIDKGAMIYSPSGQQGLAIISGSPAQKAGLKIDDVITAINGQEINLQNNLADLLYQYRKGDEIELTVLRDGQEIKTKVQL